MEKEPTPIPGLFSEEDVKFINDSWNNCEARKYLEKYSIHSTDMGYSLSLMKFIALIWNLKSDNTEKLHIKLSVGIKLSYGREYVRYTLNIKGTYWQELFIQIPYKIYNYRDGSFFTLLNINEEVNGMDSELDQQKKELVELAYADFVTNYKD